MTLTPLERTALHAIYAADPLCGPVLIRDITFPAGVSKLAGAVSSLKRKGLVTCEGRSKSHLSPSTRTVQLTTDGRWLRIA